MTERFDVVIVGGRCAGATLARQLATRGLSVCVLDRARFPSEVPSTHVIQPNGVAALERMGLLERIVAAGAPTLEQARIVLGEVTVDYDKDFGLVERVGSPLLSVRRITLDKLLLDAAAEAGADVRTETAVTGLTRDDGRVTGVQTGPDEIEASLVVGADGPNSTIARLAGAKEYISTPPGRAFLWGYFEGAVDDADRLRLGKIGDTAMLAAPTDGGLYIAAIVPSMSEKDRILADIGGCLADGISQFHELRDVLADARRIGPVRVMTRWHGFFRDPTGPGWVLVGDAGHFKDPTPGQGISDAFRQVEKLASAIDQGLASGALGEMLAEWGRWRDEDAWEMYWFATDLGAPGPTPVLVSEIIRQLTSNPKGKLEFIQLMNHDLLPSKVFKPSRAIRSLGRLAVKEPAQARPLAAEMARIVRDDVKRRRLRRTRIANAA
ncbi:MAG TPA: NAD(P)/FAD-dependent oxidoreductase [Acidimicrobiales bacterium]|nr:NAD(P)/FAD-dependent oxidoreductase [Acidimicrobiales bacterium]